MKKHGVSRHEYWRRQYRANRYAHHLERPELNKRLRDIVVNMLTVTPEAKIGVLKEVIMRVLKSVYFVFSGIFSGLLKTSDFDKDS